jgi:hypothetical protein
LLPSGAQRRNVDDLAELVDVSVRQIQQRVYVGNAELMAATAGSHDVVTGSHLSFGDHPQVESRTTLGDKQIRHLRLVETQPDPKTRHPRLGDLELRVTDAVAIADADIVVGESADGEVLSEVPRSQVVAPEKFLPEFIGLGLVDQYRALFTAVTTQIALAVTVEVEPACLDRSVHRGLPDPGVHGLVAPWHIFGHAHVHRNKLAHLRLLVESPQIWDE